jgi:hypothetical protein
MARPRKNKIVVENTTIVDDEKEQLRQQIIELSQKLESLIQNTTTIPEKQEVLVEQLDEFDSIKINQDDYIKVISLVPHTLNLTTKARGLGKLFSFKAFGETKRILYSDLVEIMESHTEHTDFLREGYYYIADKRVIRRHGLDELYQKILTKEKIEKVISCDPKEALSLFQSANKTQQQFVCDILINKLVAGEKLDLNLIDSFSRISGIKIQERAEEAKSYEEIK